MPKTHASIIIRTRNEERWIAACLKQILAQSVQDVEVILVDNKSEDRTVARAQALMPEIKVVEVDEFAPGHAINEGIRASCGEYIVCLSAHCIPTNDVWLEALLANLADDSAAAGVYGRQIPMHFTNDHDKRDLLVTFGLDRRVQRKDPFFHNANSAFPRSIWERFPFDENTTNIEDRLWAREVLTAGHHIVYEPEACVYHHHGIYQNRNEQRLRNVIQIIDGEMVAFDADESHPFHRDNLQIVAIIPVREEADLRPDVQNHLLELTLLHAQSAPSIDRVVVNTNSERLAAEARRLGADVPFLREDALAEDTVSVSAVLQQTLEWYESRGQFFDYVATLEITHPFRPAGIVQQCIEQALRSGLETVVAGIPEYRPCWWLHDNQYRRIDDYLHKRDLREPIHVGLPAICSVLTPALIRRGHRIAQQVAIVEVTDSLAQIEIRTDRDVASLNAIEMLRSTSGPVKVASGDPA